MLCLFSRRMTQFVRVTDDENEEAIEIPTEDDGTDQDGTLLLTSLIAQFPGACGLKYRSESGGLRGVRLANGALHPPNGYWGPNTYIVNFPKGDSKRKVDDDDTTPVSTKMKKTETRRCSDLIVLGLPWKSTEEDMQDYFRQFGELILTQVKRDPRSGQSKGFGFIRFKEYESQIRCLGTRHKIGGRWCEVNVPNSHAEAGTSLNRKIFVARCTEDLTVEDLREYFEEYGEVLDVFIPKPFRAFAFVTFADPLVADRLCGEDHIIKGASVHISSAEPKGKDAMKDDGRGRSYSRGGPSKGSGYGRDRDEGGWGGSGSSKHGNQQEMMPNDPGLNNIGMNMLSSAMLAAAQAVIQGNSGPGGADNYQLGPGFGGTRDSRSSSSYSGSSSGWGGDASQSGYSSWSRSGGGYSTGSHWGQGSSRGWSNSSGN